MKIIAAPETKVGATKTVGATTKQGDCHELKIIKVERNRPRNPDRKLSKGIFMSLEHLFVLQLHFY